MILDPISFWLYGLLPTKYSLLLLAIPVKFSEKNQSPHYLYVKEHKVREETDPKRPPNRTLFILNVPPYCTEVSLYGRRKKRHTFSFQIDAQIVVCFKERSKKRIYSPGYWIHGSLNKSNALDKNQESPPTTPIFPMQPTLCRHLDGTG